MFRGALATGVERSTGRATAALTSVATFALFYGLFEPRQLAIGGALALVLTFARFATGSVLAARVHLGPRCVMDDLVVVGEGASVGAENRLSRGMKVAPFSALSRRETLTGLPNYWLHMPDN